MKLFQFLLHSKAAACLSLGLAAATVPMATIAGDTSGLFAAGAQFSETIRPGSDNPNCLPTVAPDGTMSGVMTGAITGSGMATGIGAFKVSSFDCVRVLSVDPTTSVPTLGFKSTEFLMTATDGDEIVISYQGTAQPSASGLFVLSGDFTFVKGTGKFKNIRGSGTLTGVEDISTNPARGFVTLTSQSFKLK